MATKFVHPPPDTPSFILSYPAPFVLLVTINRERAMNSVPMAGHWEGDALWTWFDEEPSLRVAVLTGKGTKSFCAGADLIEQKDRVGKQANQSAPLTGFMGLSRRVGKKPVIAAVNGFALGGGSEMSLNCDMIVASPTATFGLPEAERGLYAAAGGLSRAVRTLGMQLASEIVLAGRKLTAQEALNFGLVNRIAKMPESTVSEAIELAEKVGSLSPDAIIVSRAGLREAWETASVERAAQLTAERFGSKLMASENLKIGLEAFAQKTRPQWVPSKL